MKMQRFSTVLVVLFMGAVVLTCMPQGLFALEAKVPPQTLSTVKPPAQQMQQQQVQSQRLLRGPAIDTSTDAATPQGPLSLEYSVPLSVRIHNEELPAIVNGDVQYRLQTYELQALTTIVLSTVPLPFGTNINFIQTAINVNNRKDTYVKIVMDPHNNTPCDITNLTQSSPFHWVVFIFYSDNEVNETRLNDSLPDFKLTPQVDRTISRINIECAKDPKR